MYKSTNMSDEGTGSTSSDENRDTKILAELSDFCEIKKFLSNIPKESRKSLVDTQINGSSALYKACFNNDIVLAKFLLEECKADTENTGIYVNDEDNFNHHLVPPIWSAAISNKLDIVRLLVEHGAKVNGCSDSGSTAVRAACFSNHIEMVKFLVENGADINIPNSCRSTCLMNSVESPELCEFLLEKGPNINAVDNNKFTPFMYAFANGEDVAKIFNDNMMASTSDVTNLED